VALVLAVIAPRFSVRAAVLSVQLNMLGNEPP